MSGVSDEAQARRSLAGTIIAGLVIGGIAVYLFQPGKPVSAEQKPATRTICTLTQDGKVVAKVEARRVTTESPWGGQTCIKASEGPPMWAVMASVCGPVVAGWCESEQEPQEDETDG